MRAIAKRCGSITKKEVRNASDDEHAQRSGSGLRHLAQHTRLRKVRHVDEDVVRRVTVQRRAQPLLVQVVSNEPDRAAEHEQAVQRADLCARG